jgi:hypothetical protein
VLCACLTVCACVFCVQNFLSLSLFFSQGDVDEDSAMAEALASSMKEVGGGSSSRVTGDPFASMASIIDFVCVCARESAV